MKQGRAAKAMAYYLANGCTVEQAATKFRISRQALYKLMQNQGVMVRPTRTITQRILAGEVRPAVQSFHEMSTALGCKPNTLGIALRFLGIPYRTRVDDHVDLANQLIQEATKGKKTIAELAKEFGLNYAAVYNNLKQAGVTVPHGRTGQRSGLAAQASAIIDTEGITCTRAAQRVGCSPTSVRSYRRRRGLPLALPGRPKQRRG